MPRRTAPAGFRVLFLSSRRPSPNPVRLVMLLALALLTAGVLLGPGTRLSGRPEAVPALGRPGEPAEGPSRRPSLLAREVALRARAFLRATVPLLAGVEDRQGASGPEPARWVDLAVRLLAGVDLADRTSFLRLELPLLEQLAPPQRTVAASTWNGPGTTGAVAVPGASHHSPESSEQMPVKVAVYHTHATEAYLPALAATGARRPQEAFSSDPQVGVIRVGEVLVRELGAVYGIGAVHDRSVYDAEGRLSSYERSAHGLENLLKGYPGLAIVLDLHRDEGRRQDNTVTVEGMPAARVLIVVGTDRMLPHPKWKSNYALARRMVAIMEEMYPGLSRGIRDKDYRYNQHLFEGLLLVEVGCHENTLEEALHTARLLAAVLARLLDEGRQDG